MKVFNIVGTVDNSSNVQFIQQFIRSKDGKFMNYLCPDINSDPLGDPLVPHIDSSRVRSMTVVDDIDTVNI